MKKAIAKASYLIVVLFLVIILITSCATQHKYKRIKAVPCPCEKENKR